MNTAELITLLKNASFKFKAVRCRAEGLSLKEAEFLRFLLLNAPAANSEVAQFGPGLAYRILRLGYVVNPLGSKGDAETNLWMLTATGVDLLKRLVAQQKEQDMTDTKTIDRKQFESGIRKLTRNERVIAALLKGFDTKNFVKRPELGLFPADKKEFDTVLDWAFKSGWLK